MAKHLISVCIFCFLCATHSPCEAHAEEHGNYKTDIPYLETDAPPVPQLNRSSVDGNNNTLNRAHTDIDNIKPDYSINGNEYDDKHIRKIFEKYGNGTSMTLESFTKLLSEVDLISQIVQKKVDPGMSFENIAPLISHNKTENSTEDSNLKCISHKEILQTISNNNIIDENVIRIACPAILYGVIGGTCNHTKEVIAETVKTETINRNLLVWLYSFVAVLIVSASGALVVTLIPIMKKHYYQTILQFLIALAVGTLSGDALLHLLPHAMSTEHSSHSHDDHHGESSSSHDENMWKGFVAMQGIVLFFIMERVIGSVMRKNKELEEKLPANIKVVKESDLHASSRNKKKKYEMPFSYDTKINGYTKEEYPVFRLVAGQDDTLSHNDTTSTILELNGSEPDSFKTLETNQNLTECPNGNSGNCTDVNKMVDHNESEEYTVILREHENTHHGHRHTHGHVHKAPNNLSSVVWMVIMGDGLHNFTDGMAIGAAFSSSIAGGFSTAVAVFCHELPHELGDFAMLLQAGMTMKRALFYNIVSSILCLCGNILGIYLGRTDSAISWVFAVAAGTFIYIALVDMVPELSNSHDNKKHALIQSLIQLSGLLLGVGIMTCIAIYEHDLKNIFHEPL